MEEIIAMILVVKNKDSNPISYGNYCEYISLKKSFALSVVNDKKIDGCCLTIDEKTYDYNSLFKLIVNVRNVGKFFFLFTDSSNVKDIITNVKSLGSMDSVDICDAKEKVRKLLQFTNNRYLLMTIFYGCEEGHQINEFIGDIYENNQKHLFIIKQKYIDEDIIKTKTIMQLLKIYLYRWLIILVGGISTLVSLFLGITYFYFDNKLASIVLFITSFFSLLGLSLGNYDLYRKSASEPKKKETVFCVVFDLVSIISGFGLFFLIYQGIKKDDIIIQLTTIVLLGVSFLILFLTGVLALSWLVNHKRIKNK